MSSLPTEVVALALQRESDQRYLLARRSPGSSGAGHWEFPGGKIEEGETQTEALVREINEELCFKLDPSQLYYVASHHFKYPRRTIHLHLWKLRIKNLPNFSLNEHDQISWCTREEMKTYDISPADIYFINKLL